MKIALVGYGKMGHIIKKCAELLNHEVVCTVDVVSEDASVKINSGDTESLKRAVKSSGAEGIIEFSHPSCVIENIKALLPLSLPIVVGTTGWNDKYDEINKAASDCGGIIMTSSNFSIGVNMLLKIVEEAVKIMEPWNEYDIATWEAHHNQKADSPSGTALDLAKHAMEFLSRKDTIVTNEFKARPKPNEFHVSSTRCGSVPGTHKIFFDSAADTIELTHTARSRQGFASGAVHAVINLKQLLDEGKLQTGKLYGMDDVFPGVF